MRALGEVQPHGHAGPAREPPSRCRDPGQVHAEAVRGPGGGAAGHRVLGETLGAHQLFRRERGDGRRCEHRPGRPLGGQQRPQRGLHPGRGVLNGGAADPPVGYGFRGGLESHRQGILRHAVGSVRQSPAEHAGLRGAPDGARRRGDHGDNGAPEAQRPCGPLDLAWVVGQYIPGVLQDQLPLPDRRLDVQTVGGRIRDLDGGHLLRPARRHAAPFTCSPEGPEECQRQAIEDTRGGMRDWPFRDLHPRQPPDRGGHVRGPVPLLPGEGARERRLLAPLQER
mmetsp:Transcript_102097/g.289134  ORF Transcript_102097/g.289134 Transcript_102097/m.289134 type:complete len:282 (+) Transcript_102097:368-1213(+)